MLKKGKKAVWVIVAVAVIVLSAIIIYDTSSGNVTESSTYAMGAQITQVLTGIDGKNTAEEIKDRIVRCENNEVSWRIASSDIAKLNKNGEATVNDTTLDYLKAVTEFSSKCNGAVDVTAGKLIQKWGIGEENFKVPEKDEIEKILKYVDYTKLEINGNKVTIGKNQSVDLGSVGKGIACDEAAKIVEKSKLRKAVVSVGGSVLLWSKKGNENFTVGIRNPEGDSADYMGVITMKNGFVSTSGSYERFSEENGKKYHHIISTENGYPVENDLLSVTIVCDNGLLSDALSTACFSLGYENSEKLLKEYNAQAVFIFKDKTVKTLNFDLDLKITDNSYKVN